MSTKPNPGQEPVADTPSAPAAPAAAHGHDHSPGAHGGHGHGESLRGKALAGVALAALGVVYGDIGTSPLYALRECFNGLHPLEPNRANIFGVLSLIFWALLIVVTIKYIVFILRADNHGEGGIMALTALATPIRRLEPSKRRWLVLLGVIGAALLYGDGIITPAISVLSAVEGLEIATPVFTTYVVPLTVVILIILFIIQSRGTETIGKLFGPVMLVWFGILALLGIVQVVQNPAVFQAVNPIYGFDFFMRNGWTGFLILGTVFLVVTGGEALYADMGHFGRAPIRLAWFSLVLPSLLLNYFGQGALVLRHPEAAEHSFYLMAPSWALYPLVIMATFATIIASQALISGAFSITMQAENLGFLPRLRIVHTSPTAYGQIYIPFVNWALMVSCIAVVIGFQSSSHLAAAYGIAVTSTMAITTIIFAVVARERWGWKLSTVVPLIAFFLIVDSAFLIANVVKIPHGGWFPLVVAVIIFGAMTTWKHGRRLVFAREKLSETSMESLLERLEKNPPTRAKGTAVFLSANPTGAPSALIANLNYNGVIHEQVLLTTINIVEEPHLPDENRVKVQTIGHGIYRMVLNYGFMEEPNVPRAMATCPVAIPGFDPDNALFFVNRTKVIPTDLPGMALWREQIFTIMQRNAASASDFFNLPPTRVFEINTSVEV